jgi:hypothetical protein
MNDIPPFEQRVSEHLEYIDRVMIPAAEPVPNRPLYAAMVLVKEFIPAVMDGDIEEQIDPDSPEWLESTWFRHIYRAVERWYQDKYGDALRRPMADGATAVVLILQRPYLVTFPTSVVTPGKVARVRFPDSVLEEEEPLQWIQNPPNLKRLSEDDLKGILETLKEVVSAIRRIDVALLGTSDEGPLLHLRSGVLQHLYAAAQLAASNHVRGNVQRAYWELQMACELPMKALVQYRTGEVLATHSLFTMRERAVALGAAIEGRWINQLPGASEVLQLRYAQGSRDDVTQWFVSYQAALSVISAAIAPMVTGRFEWAEIWLRQPPWTVDE